MNRREKRLLIFLAVFGGLALVVGLYSFVYSPWQDARSQAKKLQDELDDKRSVLDSLELRAAKLKPLAKRSLPGDRDRANSEYTLLLHNLMRASGVAQSSGSTITPKGDPGDKNKVPLVGPKQPAYERISFTVVLRKVDLPTVVKFLEGYYRQPVLHQITVFDLKKSGEVDSSRKADRSDLEATIITEAVIIDGTPKNAPFPTAVAGQPSLLARSAEDYKLLAAKDPFHGPLPEIPRPPKPKDEEVKTPPPPVKPLEDISAYIRLTGITWRGDGTATAEIRDMANNFDYEVSRKFNISGDLAIGVKKYWYLKNERKPLDNSEDLIIQEDGTATNRHFKVLDITAEGLILLEKTVPAAADEEPTATDAPAVDKSKSSTKTSTPGKGNFTQGKGTFGSKTPTKKPASSGPAFPQPLGAVFGGLAYPVGKPVETRWVWPVGATLKEIKKHGADATPKEASPMPRENPEGK